MPYRKPFISLRKANTQLSEVFPRPRTLLDSQMCATIQSICWSHNEDRIRCKWTASGTYSSAAVYATFIHAGKIRWNFNYIWQIPVTPTVKLFLLFLLRNKLLTQEVLLRRKIVCDPRCVLCDSLLLESHQHLFVDCQFTRQCFGMVNLNPGKGDVGSVFMNLVPPSQAKHYRAVLLSVLLWKIWIERNNMTFRDQGKLTPARLTAEAVHEAKLQHRILAMQWDINRHIRDDG